MAPKEFNRYTNTMWNNAYRVFPFFAASLHQAVVVSAAVMFKINRLSWLPTKSSSCKTNLISYPFERTLDGHRIPRSRSKLAVCVIITLWTRCSEFSVWPRWLSTCCRLATVHLLSWPTSVPHFRLLVDVALWFDINSLHWSPEISTWVSMGVLLGIVEYIHLPLTTHFDW